ALTRLAGGVIAGKTVTTEFAGAHPGATRNPFCATRTPGGSSSGSAAAVAAGMVPLALGTQTAGSIIRPASFCGVAGYKPSFGLVDATGIKPYAPSLDTVGVIARSVADCRLWVQAVSGVTLTAASVQVPVRLGWCRSPAWGSASPAMRKAFEADLPHVMERAGFEVVEIDLPADFTDAMDAQRQIMAFEAARALAFEAEIHGPALSAGLRDQIAAGRALDWPTVAAAYRLRDSVMMAFPEILETRGVAALVAPSAPGVAPLAEEGTGSADFNRLWTLLRGPCVQVPGLVCRETGLPLGVQVVGPSGGDAVALAIAERLDNALA
ncbi:MAG: amidase, partial [Rhodospirillaceae bacterium]|nr:amidase [Rhodospirillaceae bacterium]